MKKFPTFKIVICALISAIATLSFMLESLFPPLILPGARLGISNIFILLSAIALGYVYGYFTLIVKVLLGSLLSGNFFSIVYALPAGLIALTIEILLFYLVKNISLICISIVGAVINITVQNVMFCLITNTAEYLAYCPYLALLGVIGGLFVGFAVHFIIKLLPNKFFASSEIKEKNFEH